MILQTLANHLDTLGLFHQANLLDAQLTKEAAKNPTAFHYLLRDADLKSVKQKGLLAPSKLLKYPDLFSSVKQNYQERIKKVFKGPITDEIVLDYLDYSRALMADHFQFGRNCVFALLSPIKTGVSKEHDEIAQTTPIQIDLKKLSTVKGVEFYICELPLAPEGKDTAPATLKDLKWLSGVDFMSFWSKEKSEGLLFGGVPHLAIYCPTGKVPKDCLIFNEQVE